jgi:hypothetical protein
MRLRYTVRAHAVAAYSIERIPLATPLLARSVHIKERERPALMHRMSDVYCFHTSGDVRTSLIFRTIRARDER